MARRPEGWSAAVAVFLGFGLVFAITVGDIPELVRGRRLRDDVARFLHTTCENPRGHVERPGSCKSGHACFQPVLVCDYTVAGRAHRVDSRYLGVPSTTEENAPEEARLLTRHVPPVYYDPLDPDRATMSPRIDLGFLWFDSIVAVVTGLLLLLFAVLTVRKLLGRDRPPPPPPSHDVTFLVD